MLTITVAQDGSGDFASIAEAVLAVPYEEEALVQVGPGLYREKLICEKRCITLRGAGADRTRLVWGDGGKLPHKDGRPTHTFRSYTAFFSGGTLCVEDMTIENDAGPGAQAGQAVAAYVDSARAVFRRVKLLGNQDTLFCAPLPEKEREKDGFLGPRSLAPRRPTAQYYTECEIAGDIDFIFGGGDALFENCTLRTVDNHIPHSYVTAPTGWASCSGTAISSPTARRAASIWAVRGVPRGRRRCWTAASAPTSPRKASSRGMTARTPVSPPSPRPTAPARARQSVRRGCVPSPGRRRRRCWPAPAPSAARHDGGCDR